MHTHAEAGAGAIDAGVAVTSDKLMAVPVLELQDAQRSR
jgi:hypothetical protein